MRVQVVELTLSDGRVITALVPAFQETEEPRLTIKACRVYEPMDDPTVIPHVVAPPDPRQTPAMTAPTETMESVRSRLG